MRYPIYVNGDIPMQDLADAVASVGLHLRIENGSRMVLDRVPRVISKIDQANVIPISKQQRKK